MAATAAAFLAALALTYGVAAPPAARTPLRETRPPLLLSAAARINGTLLGYVWRIKWTRGNKIINTIILPLCIATASVSLHSSPERSGRPQVCERPSAAALWVIIVSSNSCVTSPPSSPLTFSNHSSIRPNTLQRCPHSCLRGPGHQTPVNLCAPHTHARAKKTTSSLSCS